MLVENAPDIISRFDRDLKHIYVGPTVVRATGLPREAFLGKSNRDLGMPKEQCDLWDEHLLRVFASGQPSSMEFEFQSPEGLHFYQTTIVPERSDGETVLSVMSVARDVTDYKIAEGRLRFLADASTVLARSLDATEILINVAQNVIAYYGDACVMNLANDAHELRMVAVAHRDLSCRAFAEMRRRYRCAGKQPQPRWC